MNGFFDAVFGAGLPTLRLRPRPGALDAVAVRKAVSAHAGTAAGGASPDRIRLLEGIGLLWNDCGDPAHEIAQAREGERDFDLLHAMFHRREGDFPNSAYWFRQAGKHPCYPILERRIASLPDAGSAGALLPNGKWSALAFVERVRACADASGDAAKSAERIQGEEFRSFAEWILAYPA